MPGNDVHAECSGYRGFIKGSWVHLRSIAKLKSDDVLRSDSGIELYEQTLAQQNGFPTTLLWIVEESDPDD